MRLTHKLALFLCLFTAGSLVSISSASAKDWSKKRSWLKQDQKRECTDMHSAVRGYFKNGFISGDDIVVSYCNMGGYVVNKVKLKITRGSDGHAIFEKTRQQNLTREWGHVFMVNAPGFGDNGETYKMEVEYTIATGKTGKKRGKNIIKKGKGAAKKIGTGNSSKKCKQSFTFNPNKNVVYMVKSEGTKWGGAKCKQIKFEQKRPW
ncbi:MAG: hypothetical protein ACE366_31325 [Bradymonadia bacterium]